MNFSSFAGQFADNVRKNIDVNTTANFIAKIGEVVAPPLASDEEYESGSDYESGSEYEDDDSYYEKESEEEEEEFQFQTTPSTIRDDFNMPPDDVDDEQVLLSQEQAAPDLMQSQPHHRLFHDSEDVTVDAPIPDLSTSADSAIHDYNSGAIPDHVPSHDPYVAKPSPPTSSRSKRLQEINKKLNLQSASATAVVPTQDTAKTSSATRDIADNSERPKQETASIASLDSKDRQEAELLDTYVVDGHAPIVTDNTDQRPGSHASVSTSSANDAYDMCEEESVDVPIPPAELSQIKEDLKQSLDTVQYQSGDGDNSDDQAIALSSTNDNTEIQSLKTQLLQLEAQLEQQRSAASQKELHLTKLCQDASSRSKSLERKLSSSINQHKNDITTQGQKQQRALHQSEQKANGALQRLEEASLKIEHLELSMEEMRSFVKKIKDQATKSDKESKRLRKEKESLKEKLYLVNDEKTESEQLIQQLEKDKLKMGGVQMELHLMKEARDRDQQQIQSTVESASTTLSKISSERDEARSKVQSLMQQLVATNADLELSRSDLQRVVMSNGNLQHALEAFQNEREAEVSLLSEQRKDAETVVGAAHQAQLVAMREENEGKMREMQIAADMAVKNVMSEIASTEGNVELLRKDNTGLRRSLDEAIQRLQMSQEDVIDRVLMKNILLDWHSKRGKDKGQVLELMANLLHFTEDEKSKVHLGESGGTLGKVVNAVRAPIPKSNLDVDKLEGDNVREKWVSFLLAETGDAAEVKPLDKSAGTNP